MLWIDNSFYSNQSIISTDLSTLQINLYKYTYVVYNASLGTQLSREIKLLFI